MNKAMALLCIHSLLLCTQNPKGELTAPLHVKVYCTTAPIFSIDEKEKPINFKAYGNPYGKYSWIYTSEQRPAREKCFVLVGYASQDADDILKKAANRILINPLYNCLASPTPANATPVAQPAGTPAQGTKVPAAAPQAAVPTIPVQTAPPTAPQNPATAMPPQTQQPRMNIAAGQPPQKGAPQMPPAQAVTSAQAAQPLAHQAQNQTPTPAAQPAQQTATPAAPQPLQEITLQVQALNAPAKPVDPEAIVYTCVGPQGQPPAMAAQPPAPQKQQSQSSNLAQTRPLVFEMKLVCTNNPSQAITQAQVEKLLPGAKVYGNSFDLIGHKKCNFIATVLPETTPQPQAQEIMKQIYYGIKGPDNIFN